MLSEFRLTLRSAMMTATSICVLSSMHTELRRSQNYFLFFGYNYKLFPVSGQRHRPYLYLIFKSMSIFSQSALDSQSVCKKLLSSWKSGKLSQESTGCTARAESMEAWYRDRKWAACSAISSGHQEKAWKGREERRRTRQRRFSQILFNQLKSSLNK